MVNWMAGLKSGRVGLAVAILSAAVALAFGTGYTASKAVLGEGGAWLSKGRTVTHVNAATAVADADVEDDLVALDAERSVVQTTSTVSVVDTTTSTVTAVDTTTMAPGPTRRLPGGAALVDFLVQGGRGYLIGGRTVQPVSALTLEPDGEPVEVGRVAGAVATSAGTVAVLDSRDGTVVELDGGQARPPVRVAPPGRNLQLTAVGGQAVVVDSAAGTVRRLRGGGRFDEPVPVPGLAGLGRADVAVNDRTADGTSVWLVLRPTGTVVGVDLETRAVRSGSLREQGRRLQAPVVLAGRVYVASGASHTVAVLDATTLEVVATHEPEGTSGRLEVFAREGRVWINDATARHALMVEEDGKTATTVDKGTGHGVEEPAPEPAPSPVVEPPPSPAAAPPPSPAAAPVPAPRPAPDPVAVETPRPAADAVPTSPPPTTHTTPATPTTLPVPPPAPAPAPKATVPSVVGGRRAPACATVVSVGFLCDDRPVRTATGSVRRDDVVAQDPAAGTEQDVGTAVVVTYYDPDPVTVPTVTGLRAANGGDPRSGPACLLVKQAGLVCVATAGTAPATGTTAADGVFEQVPAAGAKADPGDAVTITYAATVPMSDLAGLAPAEACRRATSLNLACTPADLGIGSPAGVVVSQDVTSGSAVAAGAEVTVRSYSRRPVVPTLAGQTQAGACALLAAERLGCSWAPNPTNTAENPGLANAQSAPPGTQLDPGAAVVVYHPSGPDTVLVRYRARRSSDGALLNQWVLAPFHPSGGAIGSYVYNELEGRQSTWPKDGGNAGSCYSTEVAGSVPVIDFIRNSSDPEHQDHFYASPGGGNYQRAVDSYVNSPRFVANRRLCFVLPEGTPGANEIVEWWSGGSHFYTVTEGPPAAGYVRIGQWRAW